MRAFWVAWVLALSGCGDEPGTAAPDGNALHGDLITALQRGHWFEEDCETCILVPETVVPDHQKEPERWEQFRRWLPMLRRDTYDSFWLESEEPRSVSPTGSVPMKLRVFTNDEYEDLWREARKRGLTGSPRYFRESFPGSVLLQLSWPGFSSDGRQALIYAETVFNRPGTGWGLYCILDRESGPWKIVEVHQRS